MQKHENLHAEIKPYTCNICFVAFTQPSNLKRHQQIHNTEKPYACKMCDKSYMQKNSLGKHMETCTGKVFIQLEHLLEGNEVKNSQEQSEEEEETQQPETYYINDVNELIKVEYDD